LKQEEKNKKAPKPHPDFDGHLEKPLSKMTPKEKLHYIWLQILFKHNVSRMEIISKKK
jgi:hypothetical protein